MKPVATVSNCDNDGKGKTRNRFSIVIPTLNEEKYIGQCLESIKNLDYPKEDYEVIVVDGHSDDRTREIAKRYGVRLFISDVRRCGYQRQIGVNHARFNIIYFIDADCIVRPDLLKQMDKLFQKKYISAVQGKLLMYDARFLENLIGAHIYNLSLKLLAPLGRFATGGNMAIRKEVIDVIGGINKENETNDDIELLHKARRYGFVAYGDKAILETSTRRIRKWGYLKTLIYQMTNIIRYSLTHTAHKGYEKLD
ncbi:MAG: glycosyltransferase [Candidatus Micrarchaeia archaeon]